jgi:hypothetical protein
MPQKEQAAQHMPRLAKGWKVWLSCRLQFILRIDASLDAEWLDHSTKNSLLRPNI